MRVHEDIYLHELQGSSEFSEVILDYCFGLLLLQHHVLIMEYLQKPGSISLPSSGMATIWYWGGGRASPTPTFCQDGAQSFFKVDEKRIWGAF